MGGQISKKIRRGGSMASRKAAGQRRCERCGCKLRRGNTGRLCAPCDYSVTADECSNTPTEENHKWLKV